MSAVDHINAVLKLISKSYKHENAMVALCDSFYDNGKLLTGDELLYY